MGDNGPGSTGEDIRGIAKACGQRDGDRIELNLMRDRSDFPIVTAFVGLCAMQQTGILAAIESANDRKRIDALVQRAAKSSLPITPDSDSCSPPPLHFDPLALTP